MSKASSLRVVAENGVTCTRTGLAFSGSQTYEEWVAIGEQLRQLEGAVMWWIGDWWAFGDHRYGERAAQVLGGPDDFSFQTYMNAGSVSRRIETSRRREVLSWSHHEAVAWIEPAVQDEFLALAESEGLSVTKLRNLVREHKRLLKSGEEPNAADPSPNGAKSAPDTSEAEEEPEQPDVDPVAEWERAEEEKDALQAQVDALSADDTGREIRRLSAELAQLRGRLNGEITKANEAIRQARAHQRRIDRIAKALGVTDWSDIDDAIARLKVA